MAPQKGSTNWRKGTGKVLTTTCLVCEKPFTIPLWRTRFGVGKTCSVVCRSVWLTSIRSQTVIIQCAACGKEVRRQPHASTGDRFCSRGCANDRNRLKTGENNPNWRGGRVIYYGLNWKEQRRLARERDGHTCQRCGITEAVYGQELDVHHIKAFRHFGYIVSGNDNYLTANDLTNLVSLCMRCHKEVEPNG